MNRSIRTLATAGSLVIPAAVFLPIALADPSSRANPSLAARQVEARVEVNDADDRQIIDARLAPYAAVGKFKGTMACTAAVVLNPRIITTAGHCVAEGDGTTRRSGLSFQPGYQAGTARGRFEATVWAVGSKQSFKRQSVQDAAQDWAILVLDRVPEGVQPFLLSQHPFETLKSRVRRFLMPSYSNDIGNAEILSVDPTCSIRDLLWDVLVHDCKARFGSSGSPILMQDRLEYAVVAIHTGSMFASDGEGHVAKFVGNRAIGSWMFTEALLGLSRQLNGEASRDADSPTEVTRKKLEKALR